ncbi:MAG: proline racemase family protein, partial [Saprospiraceae bacterium]|nr:proline racemase family protein [Saprospiraceae bacterium]
MIDTHCGGDISRVVTGGIARIPGADVREKMEYIKAHGDGLRRLLLSPPYGSADMSVDLIVEPTSAQADAGYIIMESMGYPGFSGSNTLCTAAALLESGIIQVKGQHQTVKLESPSGVSRVVAKIENNQVVSASCENPESYIVEHNNTAHLPGFGEITYSIAYSGVFYVLVKASDFGLRF